MSKTVKWRYNGEADVVFGEVKVSPIPKIALTTSIIMVVAICVAAFLFRDTIYDMLIHPQIILTESEVEVPYQSTFIAENYIDKVNTREYDSFINQKNHYTYNIEGTVDTNKLGDYTITYNSSNRVDQFQANLTVHVKDMEAPTIILKNPVTKEELTKAKTGEYDALIIIRDETSNKDKLGSKSWKTNEYIIVETTDNCSENIEVKYPDKPDFGKKEDGTLVKTIDYTATDESGNSTTITLSVIIMNIDDYDTSDKEDRIKELEEELARKQQEQNQREKEQNNKQDTGNNNKQDTGNDNKQDTGNNETDPDDSWRDDNWQDTPTNDDGTHTGRNPSISADSFTWSVSRDGTIDLCIAVASAYVHYYDYDYADARITSGPGITYQLEGPGTYTFHWETSTGLSCDQTVTITE